MTLRVHIAPTPQQIPDDNGIGRIIHAQYRLLPELGIEFVPPEQADVIACHIEKGGLPRVDCLHSHGIYFEDLPHTPYAAWHHEANVRIAAAAREAIAITVPSPWVAEVFKRDMRLQPHVIGHGIDLDDWQVGTPSGYVLFNKNRPSDVCSIDPVIALANADIPVVSTFGPNNHSFIRVINTQPHTAMKQYIGHADVYLATTPETFGIGTLEAMAAGVPMLGYDWCGTADLVRDGVDGILVPPGDTDALVWGYHQILIERAKYSANARERAQQYGWQPIMQQYADLYQFVADERKRTARGRVAVVISNFNYGKYLEGAIDSVIHHADEVIVVDDGSTDNSLEVTELYRPHAHVRTIAQANQGVAAARNNGIAATDCDYIICLDADDELGPEYIHACRTALDADRGLGIAYTGLGFLTEHGVQASPFPPPFDWAKQAEPHNPPHTCVPTAAMFRRSMWERAGGYKQVYAPGEDAEFYTRGLSVGFGARKVTDDPLIWYRAHDDSASRTKQYKAIDTWHPWMRDGQYPFAAPHTLPVPVRSYARPIVSVIIPVGPGHAKYLPAALDSLLGQDFRQWEVIVIHDNNDPETHINLTPYPFVREQLAAPNIGAGPSRSRNQGLAIARAPLTLFLDADDWLLPGALRAMVNAHAQTGKYIYGDAFAYGDDTPVRLRAPEYDQVGWWQETGDGTPKMHHSVTALVPTEIAREIGFDETIQGWEEQFFYADLATKGICGQRLDAPLIGYRLASGTVRHRSFEQASELVRIRRERYARFIQGDIPMACCGNTGPAIEMSQALNEVNWTGEAVPDGMTLIRYTGRATGAVTYSMVGGVPLKTKYRFAATPELVIQPVWNEDRDRLLSMGFFAIEETPPAPAPEPIVAAEPTVATEPEPQVVKLSDDKATVVPAKKARGTK